ncbi:DUF4192 domain-containing protein [Streptomyces sp. NPDC047130]|uniref:DUF4192 domain-containing protein n=1 Tax=Streptomyces sp. NPDC047130 TaxID=3155261 RepID=UPI0034084BA4
MTHREENTASSASSGSAGASGSPASSGSSGPFAFSVNGTDDATGIGTPDPGFGPVTLRSAGELADALPYLLGHRPEDCMVLVALHDSGDHGRFGGRARLGIPADPAGWQAAAGQLALGLVTGSARRGSAVSSMVAYVCQEPGPGESGRAVMERLRPLAQFLRTECGKLDVPVIEALCLSDGRYWSYCCSDDACCPADGTPVGLPGTSVLAAAAAFAGLRVRGSLAEVRARLRPWEGTAAVAAQEAALDAAAAELLPRLVEDDGRAEVAEETMALAARVHHRFASEPARPDTPDADLRDDELLSHDEAAALILGLQDRVTRDRAAEWMEGDEAAPALRLWRALSRRCVGSYGEHAAPTMTLAGWVAWSTGDEVEAREALAMALAADPDHLFARLLHRAVDEGLDPESVRTCLRGERARRAAAPATPAGPPPGRGGAGPGESPYAPAADEGASGDVGPGGVAAPDRDPDGEEPRSEDGGDGVTSADPEPTGEESAGRTARIAAGGARSRPASCRVPVRARTAGGGRGPGRADARLSRPRGRGGPSGPEMSARLRRGRRREGM